MWLCLFLSSPLCPNSISIWRASDDWKWSLQVLSWINWITYGYSCWVFWIDILWPNHWRRLCLRYNSVGHFITIVIWSSTTTPVKGTRKKRFTFRCSNVIIHIVWHWTKAIDEKIQQWKDNIVMLFSIFIERMSRVIYVCYVHIVQCTLIYVYMCVDWVKSAYTFSHIIHCGDLDTNPWRLYYIIS